MRLSHYKKKEEEREEEEEDLPTHFFNLSRFPILGEGIEIPSTRNPKNYDSVNAFTKIFKSKRFGKMSLMAFLAIYAPVGISLAILRGMFSLLWVPIYHSPILRNYPKFRCFLVRYVACPIYGFWVNVCVDQRRRCRITHEPKFGDIIVCNHVTDSDPNVIRSFTCMRILTRLTFPRAWMYDPLELYHFEENEESKKNVKSQLMSHVRARLRRKPLDENINNSNSNSNDGHNSDDSDSGSYPLMVFPEGGTTSGRAGILRYNRFVFSLGVPISPVAIRYRAFFGLVSLDHLAVPATHTATLANMAWTLFVPFVEWDLFFLEEMTASPGEKPEDFARRAQVATASALGVDGSDYSYADKRKCRKYLYGF